MPSCAVVTCKHRSVTTNFHTDGITYHRFPRKPEVKEKWIIATGRGPVWWPLKTNTICSCHFKENEFQNLPKSRRLFDSAVPTLRLPYIPPRNLSSKHGMASRPTDIEMKVLKTPASDSSDSDGLEPISDIATDSDTNEGSGSAKPKEAVACELQTSILDKDTESVSHDETPRKRTMRLQIESYKTMVQQKNRKIRTLQQNNSRYMKKIADLKAELKELRDKNLVYSDHIAHLENSVVADPLKP